MTLAFTFPIKDAWIIVADKGVISKLDTTDEMLNKITTFSDNAVKIQSLNHNLFFVGTGDQDILEKIVEIINNSPDFSEFKDNIFLKMNEAYSDFGGLNKKEVFLIIDKELQEALKFETELIRNDRLDKGVCSLSGENLKDNFIGSFRNNTNLGYVKTKISSLREVLFTETDEKFNDICNDMLSLLSVDYPNMVGHPSIQGSNIWIISKGTIRKVFTFPKNNYDYEVKEE